MYIYIYTYVYIYTHLQCTCSRWFLSWPHKLTKYGKQRVSWHQAFAMPMFTKMSAPKLLCKKLLSSAKLRACSWSFKASSKSPTSANARPVATLWSTKLQPLKSCYSNCPTSLGEQQSQVFSLHIFRNIPSFTCHVICLHSSYCITSLTLVITT